ncbi:precorrin-3B synthase [Leptolyngbya sp. FACHB-321]|nr:precorrin-3B synthase [Leptolyngbya sp. FACHB-321]
MPTGLVSVGCLCRLLPASHGEGVKVLSALAVSPFATCPGLFQPSAAQDGLLLRLRIPGGLLTVPQCEAISDLADQFGGGYVEVTNRANVQIRELQAGITTEMLDRLQNLDLAAPIAAVDSLRNIMCSPTAGIDRQQLLDTRPFVAAWNRYLTTRPDFAVLSPKFSVCFDGGEAVSVRDRPNDISLVAVKIGEAVWFRLHLNLGERGAAPCDVKVLIKPEESLQVLSAIAEIYRDYTSAIDTTKRRKPRLKELLHDWGVENFLQAVARHLPFPLQRSERTDNVSLTNGYQHLAIHSQRQTGLSYIGTILPLGRLETQQLRGLATLAAHYGSGILRFTPWQNVLLPDLQTSQIAVVQQKVEQLGLHTSATHPQSAIVACSGTTGCKSSATNTQADALALVTYLEQHIALDCPINIHFSGCEKSCAQHHTSDIALVGVAQNGYEAYHVYVGEDASDEDSAKFGRSLYQNYAFTQLPGLVEQMLRVYQNQRLHSQETFKHFVKRHTIAELQQILSSSSDCGLMGVKG